MLKVLSTKTSPPIFSATCEVSKYLETNAGILKDRLERDLNMHLERTGRAGS
jgi:hypothetical protein